MGLCKVLKEFTKRIEDYDKLSLIGKNIETRIIYRLFAAELRLLMEMYKIEKKANQS